MHPLCEVVKVLAVLLPFQLFIKRFARLSFAHSLADPEAAGRGVPPALSLVEPADPAFARIVFTVLSKNVMHLVDKPQCQFFVFVLARSAPELQEVAHGECVGPQVTTGILSRWFEACRPGKFIHNMCN
jgi:hypothetical protein